MSGAQIVFGIARRVPSPNTPKQSLDATNVSCSAKQIPHTTAESIIFHESNPLTTFGNVTQRHHPVIISNRFFVLPLRYAVSLARLVKAEIVSPYCGILINTGMDNPTVLLA